MTEFDSLRQVHDPREHPVHHADDWSSIARCYGNDVIKTPNVDALAERGVMSDYARSASARPAR